VNDPSSNASRSRRERAHAWLEGRRQQLDAARTTSPTVGFAFEAFSYDTDTGAPVLAAALGFRVFLFQVPYACAWVIASGFIADLTGREPSSLFRGRGIAHLMATSVSGASQFSGWARASAFIVTVYALFLSARSFLKVVNIVHALVWDVPRTRLARANRAAVAFIATVTLLLAASVAISALRSRSAISGIVVLILLTTAPFVFWWFASWKLPHRPCPMIGLAPGAALFALGVQVLHVATVVWFPHYIASKSDVYGTIGIAVVLLLWAYLLGRVITLAAVLNAALWVRFWGDAEQPVHFARPSRRVPLIDDKVSRVWAAFFGGDIDGDPADSAQPEAPPDQS
jgi:uncharacterized BrkB/YihY/UPF0761 family membrane protein